MDVVIPTFNRKRLLPRALRSVLRQTHPRLRIFVADDGSTDGTEELFLGPNPLFKTEERSVGSANSVGSASSVGSTNSVNSANSDSKIQFLRWKRNRGVSYARNQAIKQGRADWIAFLDSDDEWLPSKLEKQLQYAAKRPRRPLIHCNEIWLRNGKALPQKKKHKKQGGRIFASAVRLCCVSPSASLVRRSFLEKAGLFREDFPVCEDFELWLRLSARCETGFLSQALLIKHGGHQDQLSKKYFGMDYWRVKALLPFLESSGLSLEEKKALRESLKEKTAILMKTCRKHNNQAFIRKLEPFLQKMKRHGLNLSLMKNSDTGSFEIKSEDFMQAALKGEEKRL